MLQRYWFMVTLLATISASAETITVVTDEDLTHYLQADLTPLTSTNAAKEYWCNSKGCAISVEDIVLWRSKKYMQRGKTKLTVKNYSLYPSKALPALASEPYRQLQLTHQGKPWGLCLAYAHEGLGSSGSAQRWHSLILIPQHQTRAYRFIGYQLDCDLLATDGSHIVLSLIELTKQQILRKVSYRCDTQKCESSISGDHIEYAVENPSALMISR